ncbi:LamG-like jellyroll fold domain-containing protein [Acanthopleuribacter pedis]|uniref:Carboxypeptidase regulatory-like domain-containing protein n=1 Tax=Acanthopleuribacter pedis TaxID=442870 RepID=A0A8J7U4L0_9BACT|nr:LamG-like jellyroll fold domain-containing protein [Acanthopleuribacter pedis]MBO1318411.1 carboxypeptidase regulatory-like domain-containing protein [Acanthopleuribacter pedis]
MMRFLGLILVCLPIFAYQSEPEAEPLTPLQALFRVEQQGFQVSPERQVLLMEDPEGSVFFEYFYDGEIPEGLRLEALLVSPNGTQTPLSQPYARGRLEITRDQIDEEGTWQLTNLQLMDGDALLAESNPEVLTIEAVAELLVSRATVEQLSREELAELGYVFSEDDYRAVRFNLSLLMGAVEVPVEVPVLIPTAKSEIFSRPEVIQDPFGTFKILVSEPRFPGYPALGFDPDTSSRSVASDSYMLSLIVIPGKIHHLKSLFRVAVVTMNAAPEGIDARVDNLKAKIEFPVPTKYGHPLGLSDTQNGGLERPMVYLGADGEIGTWDDREYIDAAEEAMAEYYLRGNVPGIHDVRFDIQGQAHLGNDRTIPVRSEATARVYVRNPDFTVTFEHPETVAEGEPYDLTMHINNVGAIPLNDFHIEIDPYRLVGVTMAAGTNPTQRAGDIPPGGEAALTWGLRADTTGQVVASYYRVEEGISSALQLSVGVSPTGETLTNRVLSFPAGFRGSFEPALRDPIIRLAKKVYDLSHMEPEEVPGHLLPVTGGVATAFNEELAFAGATLGLGADAAQVRLGLMRSVIGAMDGVEAIDRMRRESSRLGEPEMEAIFEPFLREAAATRSARELLLWMARESFESDNTGVVLVEGPVGMTVSAEDALGRVVATTGALDLPFSAWFDLGDGRHLAWLGEMSGSVTLKPRAVNGQPLRVHAVFNRNAETELLYFDSGSWSPSTDPDLVLLPESAQWHILEDGVSRFVAAETVPNQAFTLVGVKQMASNQVPGADPYGRHITFMFSKPVDLRAFSDLADHITINGHPVQTAKVHHDPRFLMVKSPRPVGPYQTNEFELFDITARDGTVIAYDRGTFEGDAFFNGVRVTGRVVDRSGSDIQDATVYLELPAASGDGDQRGLIIVDKATPDDAGRYQFDFVPVHMGGIPVPPTEDNPFEFDASLLDRLRGFLNARRKFRVTVQLADGRFEFREFHAQAPGQEVIAEFSFLNRGTIYGQVTDADGLPIADSRVFAQSEGRTEAARFLVPTDENGMYRIEGIEVGRVLLKTVGRNGAIGMRSLFLTRADSPMRADIGFTGVASRLSGRVLRMVDGQAEPVANAVVGWAAEGTQPLQWRPHPLSSFIAPYNGITEADTAGFYNLEDIPAGTGILWAFADGYYQQLYLNLAGVEGMTQDLLQREADAMVYGTVRGRVVDIQNFPLQGLEVRVGGFETLSASDGSFELAGLPLYQSLNGTIEIQATLRDAMNQTLLRGKASVGLSPENPLVENVLITAISDPKVSGEYLDNAGNPIPFAPIYNPPDDGLKGGAFAYTDHQGRFTGSLFDTSRFPGMYWDPHQGVQTGNNLFSGYRFPKIAITEVTVGLAGYENVVVQEEPQSQVRVRLVDGQGAPVIGRIQVHGYLPSNHKESLGMPVWGQMYSVTTEQDGSYLFTQLNVRDTTIHGTHPLLGETNRYEYVPQPLAEGDEIPVITLAFSSQNEPTNLYGRLMGTDGVTPAPEGTLVIARVGGVIAKTRTNPEGWYWFDTLVSTAAKQRVNVAAYHPDSREWVAEIVEIDGEMRFRHDMTLSGRGSVQVRLVDAEGNLLDTGSVSVHYTDGTYQEPSADDLFGELQINEIVLSDQVLPGQEAVLFENLPVGEVTVKGVHGNGLTGMSRVSIPRDGRYLEVFVRVETPASISGIFTGLDEVPVAEGEVQLRHRSELMLQKVTAGETDPEPGLFVFEALPMRKYSLHGRDPDTGLKGSLEVQPTPFNPDPRVNLRIDPVGHIDGVVQYEGQVVANAKILVMDDRGEVSGRKVKFYTGTDEFGRFEIRNLPLDRYVLKVETHLTPARGLGYAHLLESNQNVTAEVAFRSLHEVALSVTLPDGQPARFMRVSMNRGVYKSFSGAIGYTDENGLVVMRNLPPGAYQIWIQEQRYLDQLVRHLNIGAEDPQRIDHAVQFDGWGSVYGQVTDEVGVPLDFPVIVQFLQNSASAQIWTKISTDAAGFFRWDRVPLNTTLRLIAVSNQSFESESATVLVTEHGDAQEVNVRMRRMTRASGQVQFADGTPAPYAKVWVEEPMEIIGQADAQGRFTLEPVRSGQITLFAKDALSPRSTQVGLVSENQGDGTVQPHTDVTLRLAGVGSASGRVTLSDGTGVNHGYAYLENVETGAVTEVALFADGSWLRNLLPLGNYRYRAFDAERLEWAADEPEFSLAADGGSVTADLSFHPSYEVRGRVLAPGGLNGIENALVELQRAPATAGGRWQRVFRTTSRDDGFYFMEHVYPGAYRVVVTDELSENVLTAELLVRDGDVVDFDLELRAARNLSGVVVNAANQALYPGTVRAFAPNGRVIADARLNALGEFRMEDLSYDQVHLAVSALGGWYTFERTVGLQSGDNAVSFVGPATVTVTGRVVVQQNEPAPANVAVIYGGISRGSKVPDNGLFQFSLVPAGQVMDLWVGSSRGTRTVQVGPFDADTDLGDILLDNTPPQLAEFPNGIDLTAMPATVTIPVVETDATSGFDPTRTKVWLNGNPIAAYLVPDNNAVVLRFNDFPSWAVRGHNVLKVQAGNLAGVFTTRTYALNINVPGTALAVRVIDAGDGVVAGTEVWLENGSRRVVDENGRVYFYGLANGEHRVWSMNTLKGVFTTVTMNNTELLSVAQDLYLQPAGAFQGRVTDLEGLPLSGVTVWAGNQPAQSDENGLYRLAPYPIGVPIDLRVEDPVHGFGYLEPNSLSVAGSTSFNQDIQVTPTGTLVGVVTDQDGATPITDVTVILDFDSLPDAFGQAVQVDADGAFRMENVPPRPLQLTARQNNGDRAGFVTFDAMQPGQTVTLNIALEPVGRVQGRLLGRDGSPLAGISLEVHDARKRAFAQAVSAGDGTFTLDTVPYGDFSLFAEDQNTLAYVTHAFTLSENTLSLGDVTMVADLAPQVVIQVPSIFDPTLLRSLSYNVTDDRQLASITLVADDYPEHGVSGELDGIGGGGGLPVPLPEPTPHGTFALTATVVDHFGQTGTWRGQLVVGEDLTPPTLTITEPTDTPTVTEGETLRVRFTSDSVRTVISYQGVDLRLASGGAYNDRYQDVRVPPVSASGVIALDVAAYDQKGNVARASVPINVQDVSYSGAPALQVISHRDGQPMPLNLDRDLTLTLRARMSDPDGLLRQEIFVDGVSVFADSVFAESRVVTYRHVLPPAATAREQLEIRWVAEDVGFNQSEQTITLVNINGTLFDADNPLQANRLSSPYDGQTLILAGGTHLIDGRHAPRDLILVNEAEVRQTPSSPDLLSNAAVTELDVTGNLVVDVGSWISADQTGFPELALYPDASAFPTHGGLSQNETDSRLAPGSLIEPMTVGNERGGGALRLHAANFYLFGTVSADGGNWGQKYGPGGSIWLQSPNLIGFGDVRANAFRPGDSVMSGDAGGGRIAVHGAGADLTLSAAGRRSSGHGTVFMKFPDASMADGTRDTLRIAGRDAARMGHITPLPWFTGVVGEDVTFLPTQQGPDGYRDKLILPFDFGIDHYRGLYVWRDGAPEQRARIDRSVANELVSEVNQAFPVFQAGDRIRIGYPLDEIELIDGGRLMTESGVLDERLVFQGGYLQTEQTLTLREEQITGNGINLLGDFQINRLQLNAGQELHASGSLTLTELTLAEGAVLRGAQVVDAPSLYIQADQMVIDGEIILAAKLGNLPHLGRHGGLIRGDAAASALTSGSLYRPGVFAGGVGGFLHLGFDTLTLNGSLSVRDQDVAGALLLEGRLLQGSGSLNASGGRNAIAPAYPGGRLAVWVDDVSGFSGDMAAFGYTDPVGDNQISGAGTLFIKTAADVQGRLIVDNGGRQALVDSTLLPIFGTRSAGAGTTTTTLAGNFPAYNEFVGMYLSLEGQEPQAIVAQTETTLTLAGEIPTLAAGQTVTALHRFDELVARGGAALYTTDRIEVSGEVVLDGGTVNAPVERTNAGTTRLFRDGAGELSQDDGTRVYEVDNFHLTVRFPMDVERISLRNGATLTYYEPIRVGLLEADQATLRSGLSDAGFGVTSETVTLINNSVWTAVDNDPDLVPARINIDVRGTLSLDAGSTIIADQLRGGGLSAGTLGYDHGGYDFNVNGDKNNAIYGSAIRPVYRPRSGGGAIRLRCGVLDLSGTVSAPGASSSTLSHGGSIWIEALQWLGSGRIDTGDRPGRIALYHGGDTSFLNRYQIVTYPADTGRLYSAGTLYLKGPDQAHGELIINQEQLQNNTEERMARSLRLTGVTGPAEITLAGNDTDPDPLVIHDPSWTELPDGLDGLWVRFTVDGTAYETQILTNQGGRLELAPPASGVLPDVVPVDTTLRFRLKLDRLHLLNGAQLYFAGDLELGELVLDDSGRFGSIWARDLHGMPENWTLTDSRLRLTLDEPTWDAVSISLQNSELWLDKPIVLNRLSLVNSAVKHSASMSGMAAPLYQPWLHVTAQEVTMDAQSRFAHGGFGQWWLSGNSSRNHGGTYNLSSGETYGALFQPNLPGSSGSQPGGRIYLKTEVLNAGVFDVVSRSGASGSIWVDAGTVTGRVELKAGMTPEAQSNHGGGRVAFYYDHIDQAEIIADTSATYSSGTFLLQNRADAYGTLVIDNKGVGDENTRLTTLPTFAPLTVDANRIQETGAGTSTLWLPGVDLPDFFRGYQLVVNGDESALFPITAMTVRDGGLEIRVTGDLPTLQVGDILSPVLRLARLDLCLGCQLGPAGLRIMTGETYPAGHVFNGGTENFVDAPNVADGHLILDNFTMEIQGPVDYSAVTLRNGATLRLKNSHNQIGQLVVDGGSVFVEPYDASEPTLIADDLHLRDGAELAVLFLEVRNELKVYSGAVLKGMVFEGENIHWGSDWLDYAEHPIFGGAGSRDSNKRSFGDFRQPWEVMNGFARLRIKAGTADINGTVFPGFDPEAGDPKAGGALWAEITTLRGAGRIHSDAPPTSNPMVAFPGGGRIAVYYGDMSQWHGGISANGALFQENSNTIVSGSGTVFMKSDLQTYGELWVHGIDDPSFPGSTRVSGLGRHRLSDGFQVDGTVLTDPGAEFLHSLRGLTLVIDEEGTPQRFEIVDNTHDTLTVDRPLPALTAGTLITAELHLDRVWLTGGARLHTPDHVVLHGGFQPAPNGADRGDLWCRRLSFPSDELTLTTGSLGLRVEESTNLTSVTVSDATLVVNGDLNLTRLTLNAGGTLTHTKIFPAGQRPYAVPSEGLHLTLDQLVIAAGARVDVDGLGPNSDVAGQTSSTHAGRVRISDRTYGSLFEPNLPGGRNGGGLVDIRARIIQHDGEVTARGYLGGSIRLEAETLTGNGLISVDSTPPASGILGSAGRVALYYDENQLTRLPSAASYGDPNAIVAQPGAGTVYLRRRQDEHGDLYLVNGARGDAGSYATPLNAVGSFTLPAPLADPRVIVQPDADWRTGYEGMEIIDLQTQARYRIVAFDRTSLTLDRPISPVPGAGWAYRGQAPIRRVYTGNAVFEALDPNEVQAEVVDGFETTPPTINSVTLDLPLADAALSGQPFRVTVDASDNSTLAEVVATFAGETQTRTGSGPFVFAFNAPTVSEVTGYPLQVTARDAVGNQSQSEQTLNVFPADQEAPALTLEAPLVDAEVDAGVSMTVRVSATDNYGLDQIIIRFGNRTETVVIADKATAVTEERLITVPEVVGDQALLLQVEVLDASGLSQTMDRSVQVRDTTPPPPPISPSFTPESDALVVRWAAPVDAPADLAGFELALDGVGDPVTLAAEVTEYRFSGLTPDTTYAFSLRSLDASGNRSEPLLESLSTLTESGAALLAAPDAWWSFDRNLEAQNAMSMSGSAAGMAVAPMQDVMRNADGLTVATWFRADVVSGSQSLFEVVGSGTSERLFELYLSGDRLYFHTDQGTGSSGQVTNVAGIEAGRWYRTVATVDYNSRQMHLYLDGVQVASRSVSGSGLTEDSPHASMTLGGRASNSRHFLGDLRDTQVWRTPWPAGDVAKDWAYPGAVVDGAAAARAGFLIRPDYQMVAAWSLDGRNTTLAVDRSGNQNHGTFNAVTWESTGAHLFAVPDHIAGLPGASGPQQVIDHGLFGRALVFDGTQTELVWTAPVWQDTGFATAIMVRLDALPSDLARDMVVFQLGNAQLKIDTQNRPVWQTRDGTLVTGTDPLQSGRWYHLGVNRDQGTTHQLIVDGVVVASAPVTDSTRPDGAWTLAAGVGGTEPLVGALDEWLLWSRPVSAADLGRLATQPLSEANTGAAFRMVEAVQWQGDATGLDVSWQPVVDGPPAAGWLLTLDGGTPIRLSAATRSYRFSGLIPERGYQLQVQAETAGGDVSRGVIHAVATAAVSAATDLGPTARVYLPFDAAQGQQQSLSFTHDDGKIRMPTPGTLLDGAEGFTFAAWIKTPSNSGTRQILEVVGNTTSEIPFDIYLSSGRIYLRAERDLAQSTTTLSSSSSLNVANNQWHRLVAVVDYVGNTLKIYLNGEEVASRSSIQTGAGPLIAPWIKTIVIGGHSTSAGRIFGGSMGDVQLWRKPWQAADVAHDWDLPGRSADQLTSGTQLQATRDLVFHLISQQSEGSTIFDRSGSGMHGVVAQPSWDAPPPINWFKDPLGDLVLAHNGLSTDPNGKIGAAGDFGFGMTHAHLDVPNLQTQQGVSVAWWLKVAAAGQDATVLTRSNQNEGLAVGLDTDLRPWLLTAAGNRQTAGAALTPGVWHQLTLTLHPSEGSRLYLDGRPVVASTEPATLTAGPWRFAHGLYQIGRLNGAVDEFTLWETRLTPAQILRASSQTEMQQHGDLFEVAVNHAEVVDWVVSSERNALRFTWQPPAGTLAEISGYRVYRDGVATGIFVAAPQTTHYWDGLDANGRHTLRVTTVDTFGNESTGVTMVGWTGGDPAAASAPATPTAWYDFNQPGLSATIANFPARGALVRVDDAAGDAFAGAGGVTLACWFRTDATSPSSQNLVQIWSGNNTMMRINLSSGRLRAYARASGSGSSYSLTTTPVFNDGLWHRAVVAADFTGQTLKIFVDGALVAERTVSYGVSAVAETTQVTRFEVSQDSSNYFVGSLWDAQIWRAPFDAAAVVADFSDVYQTADQHPNVTNVTAADKVVHWRLDAGTNGTANDGSGNERHGVASDINWLSEFNPVTGLRDQIGSRDLMLDGGGILSPSLLGEGLALHPGQAGARVAASQMAGLSGAFSWSFWVQPNQSGASLGGVQRLLTVAGERLGVSIGEDDRLLLVADGVVQGTSAAALALDQWVHVALVAEPGQNAALYLNGNRVAEVGLAADLTLADGPVVFGGRDDGLKGADAGFDQAGLWLTPLTPAQIHWLHQNPAGASWAKQPRSVTKVGEPETTTAAPPVETTAPAAVVVSTGTEILRNRNLSEELYQTEQDLVLDATTLELNGSLIARSIELRNGSRLTHPVLADGQPGVLLIAAAERIEIDRSSLIDLDGRGWHQQGEAVNPAHAVTATGDHVGTPYGSVFKPDTPGGGEQGGGSVVLIAPEIILDGRILARGVGTSSGGSILIQAADVSGDGTMDVSGGSGENGRGGAGRLAVHADQTFRFGGTMITGLTNRAAILIADSRGENRRLIARWPEPERLAQPLRPVLPPPLHLVQSDFSNVRVFAGRLVAEVQTEVDLSAYLGFSAQSPQGVVRLGEASRIEADRWLIQLDGERLSPRLETLDFIFEVVNREQLLIDPSTVPVREP